jgi:flagellar biosynthesis protein FlhF
MMFRNFFAIRRNPAKKKIRRAAADTNIISFPQKFHARLTEIFKFHKIPPQIAEKLFANIDDSAKTIDIALEKALAAVFEFEPLKFNLKKPLMVVGMPGIGKTLAISKMATEASFFGRRVNVISTDIKRAGGVEQLTAFTRLIGVDLVICRNPDELKDQLAKNRDGITLIDTPGANPFDQLELELTRELLQAADVEPVLVLQAGGDVEEAIDIANAYKFADARRMLITKADTARRLGGIFAAVDNNGLCFSNFSGTPNVGKGLEKVSAKALARLLLKPMQDNA